MFFLSKTVAFVGGQLLFEKILEAHCVICGF